LFTNTTFYDYLARLLIAVALLPIHEYAHGYTAYKLGDPTAKNQGRLTLNPIKHMDLLGTLLLVLAGFGWAKPVPVNPRNFKRPKEDMGLTAAAGPASNLLMALALMIVMKLMIRLVPYNAVTDVIFMLLNAMVGISISLAIFNLIPVPPLDGSRILGLLLPNKVYYTILKYERYISIGVFLLIMTGILSKPLSYLTQGVYGFFNWITGFIY